MPLKKKKAVNKEEALEQIMSEYEGIIFKGSSPELAYERIPFCIKQLDELIGGGVPKKRITLLSGQTNSGKSYLASQAVSNVQKMGGKAIWVDSELSWDNDWMAQCGIQTDDIIVAQPHTGEEIFAIIRKGMEAGIDIIVLDSIAGVVPANIIQEDTFGVNPMAWQARFINQSIPKLMPYLRYGSALLLINQQRSGGMGPTTFLDTLPGGKGQTFFSHLVLQIRRSGWIGSADDKEGFDIEIINRKTKAGGYNQAKCIVPFKFDTGYDMIENYIREAIKQNKIKRSGAWFQIPDVEDKIMGMNNLKVYYQDHLEDLEKIINGSDTNMIDRNESEEEENGGNNVC